MSRPRARAARHLAAGAVVVLVTGVAVLPAGLALLPADGGRFALYVFAPDRHRRVECRGGLLGTIANPTGGRQVTYAGWPLYRYAGDLVPGEAGGRGLDRNGGGWYTIAASGRPVHR